MAKIALRAEGLQRLARRAQIATDAELARRMEITHSQLTRVLGGQNWPGNRFIAGALATFGSEWFEDLFTIITDAES